MLFCLISFCDVLCCCNSCMILNFVVLNSVIFLPNTDIYIFFSKDKLHEFFYSEIKRKYTQFMKKQMTFKEAYSGLWKL